MHLLCGKVVVVVRLVGNSLGIRGAGLVVNVRVVGAQRILRAEYLAVCFAVNDGVHAALRLVLGDLILLGIFRDGRVVVCRELRVCLEIVAHRLAVRLGLRDDLLLPLDELRFQRPDKPVLFGLGQVLVALYRADLLIVVVHLVAGMRNVFPRDASSDVAVVRVVLEIVQKIVVLAGGLVCARGVDGERRLRRREQPVARLRCRSNQWEQKVSYYAGVLI